MSYYRFELNMEFQRNFCKDCQECIFVLSYNLQDWL